MHYIEYIPGTVARITDKPTQHGHEDVNLLSRWVSKFNREAALHFSFGYQLKTSYKLKVFETMFQQFFLPCSS